MHRSPGASSAALLGLSLALGACSEREPEPAPPAAIAEFAIGNARVRVRVFGPGGWPVEGFQVDLHPATFQDVGYSVRLSEEGIYEITGLSEGFCSLVAVCSAPGLATGVSEPFCVGPGGSTTGVEVHLGVGGEVRGLVLDSRTGEPLVGAEVTLQGGAHDLSDLRGMARARVETGPDGRYRIEHVGSGAHTLTMHAHGHAAAFVEEVCVADGKVLELPPQSLGPGATITGVVHGPDGTPLVAASVQLGPAIQRFPGHRTTRTDAKGAFRIEDVTLGVYELSATRPNSGLGDPFEAINDMKSSQRTIRLEAATSYAFDLELRGR